MDSLWNFVKEYYIDSIVYKEGYNPVNTLTWAVILILAVLLIYRFLEKRVEIDERFVYANIPFILLGSSVRVVEDAGFLSPPVSYAFMSPFIYLLIFMVALPSLVVSLKVFGKEYYKAYSAVGVVLSGVVIFLLLANLQIVNWWVLPAGLILAATFAALYYIAVPRPMKNRLSALTMFSHMLDGFETYFGITYLGYWELHVLPRFLIERFGAVSLPVVKFLVFLLILYVLDTGEESERLKNFVKFVLIVLGLAPGLRDGIRMVFAT